MTTRTIAWEPHPCTPVRKAELMGAGFRLLDAALAPPDLALVRVRLISADPASPGLVAQISERDFDPQLHTVYDPEAQAKAAEAEAERLRLQAEAEAAQKAEAERLAAVPQPEAAQAAEAPATTTAATPARKRAGSTTPTTEA